jgi:uncharacterized protein
MTDPLPSILAIAIRHGVTNPPGNSYFHGENHWKAVALAGLWIAEKTSGADLGLVLAFSLLHDLMREDEGEDPQHGHRAAILLSALLRHPGLDGFAADTERARDLRFAIRHHCWPEHARHHHNPSVGVCWDADRVNLWRVGTRPDTRLLTTEAALTGGAIDYGRQLW